MFSKNRIAFILITLLLILIVLVFLSLLMGRYSIGFFTVLKVLTGQVSDGSVTGNDVTVILQIRLPRILAALLVGAALSVSGAALQGLFRNPLVSPFILGVSSGSGFGAALAILWSFSSLLVETSAFFFGLAAAFLSMLVGRSKHGTQTLSLVLAGIIVGSTFTALISLVKYVADPLEKLPAIVFWLMGSLASIGYGEIGVVIFPIAIGIILLLLLRWKLNILSMGEEEAQSLGVNPVLMRGLVIAAASLITAASVSVSGIIGWVGLVIPHIVRSLFGPDYRVLIPASIILGASYMLIIDDISRSLINVEIPLGILTAIIGAPIFAYILKSRRAVWA